jgi:predicted transcriptional regulator
MTKTDKLLTLLKSGNTYSRTQIEKATGLRNPGEAVAALRRAGHCVYTNKNGYRLGTPTKRMVALANLVGGALMFKG